MLVNFSEEWAVLICRTSAFFMMVDGDVSISESNFVRKFVEELSRENDFTIDPDAVIAKTMESNFDLNDILRDTDELLAQIDESARSTVLMMLATFISTVILADDTLTPEENIAFRKWKHHYKLAF